MQGTMLEIVTDVFKYLRITKEKETITGDCIYRALIRLTKGDYRGGRKPVLKAFSKMIGNK